MHTFTTLKTALATCVLAIALVSCTKTPTGNLGGDPSAPGTGGLEVGGAAPGTARVAAPAGGDQTYRGNGS